MSGDEKKRLDGKVALVTGSGGGIGKQYALHLARQGARIIVNDIGIRTGANADEVVEEIKRAGGEAVPNGDSATWDGAEDLIGHSLEAYGQVDILINNATYTRMGDFWDYAESDYDATFAVNLKGYFATIRYLAPHMAARGTGVIMNTSSNSGMGHAAHTAYGAAKEGVVGLTRSVARELGHFGVRCNAVRPLAAGQSAADFKSRSQRWWRLTELTMEPRIYRLQQKMLADPEAMPTWKAAPLVVWLCTDAAAGVNGRTFELHGDTVTRLSEPEPVRAISHEGGWDLDLLDRLAPEYLVDGVKNDFLLAGEPDLPSMLHEAANAEVGS